MENWKAIEGFENYEVSDLGRVRGVDRTMANRWGTTSVRKGCTLKFTTDRKGYLRVCLSKEGKQSTKRIHLLVAQAFIPNPLNLPQVNHTGEKFDNRAIKLERISAEDHGKDRARRGQGRGDGVYASGKRWVATYCPEPNRIVVIGRYSTYEEAKAARDEKVTEL